MTNIYPREMKNGVRFYVMINVLGKLRYFGSYETEDEATSVRDEVLSKLPRRNNAPQTSYAERRAWAMKRCDELIVERR